MGEFKPHKYVPDAQAMGDCRICGAADECACLRANVAALEQRVRAEADRADQAEAAKDTVTHHYNKLYAECEEALTGARQMLFGIAGRSQVIEFIDQALASSPPSPVSALPACASNHSGDANEMVPSPTAALIEAGRLAVEETRLERSWSRGVETIVEKWKEWQRAAKARRAACAAIIAKEETDG